MIRDDPHTVPIVRKLSINVCGTFKELFRDTMQAPACILREVTKRPLSSTERSRDHFWLTITRESSYLFFRLLKITDMEFSRTIPSCIPA